MARRSAIAIPCQRCGASCQGLRARIEPDERERIAADAVRLGVERPLVGQHLRQNWGTCVFYAEGCRLHAELGVDAKPSACRRFPARSSGIDPACFHPGPTASPDPWPGWNDLGIGHGVRTRLIALPLRAVRKANRLGGLTAAALEGLEHSEPRAPGAWTGRLDWRARQAMEDLAHHPDAEQLLVGGGQLLCGLGRPGVFAAWIRLLRVLPQL